MSVREIACDRVVGDLNLETRKFGSKEDIKPWLQSVLLNRKGIHIVIERSDANKIIFKCKGSRKKDGEVRGKGSSRRRKTCPFKIRANFSSRSGQWSLVVIDENHDHQLEEFSQLPVLEMYNKNENVLTPGSGDIASILQSKTSTPMDVFGTFTDLTSDAIYSNELPKDGAVENKKRRHDSSEGGKKKRIKEHKNVDRLTRIRLMENLRKEVNRLINDRILSSKDFSDPEKAYMLRVFTSQLFVDHRETMMSISDINSARSPQPLSQEQIFDTGLRNDGHNDKNSHNSNPSCTDDTPSDDNDREDGLASSGKLDNSNDPNMSINSQTSPTSANSTPTDSHGDSGRHDVNMKNNVPSNNQKPFMNSWLSTSSAAHASGTNPNTNLIPLSPLLNDSDGDYQTPHGGSNNGNHSIDNLYHLPGISLNSSLNYSSLGNFGVSTSMSQIQNQTQQLPSFNTIQNQLPLSPGLSNNSAASIFANSLNNGSLIPPISNSMSNTLNPSHLIKGNSKGSVLNLNQGSSLMNINEIKNNSAFSNYNVTTGSAINSHNSVAGSGGSVGVSSPNNNIIHLAYQSMSSTYNKETNVNTASNVMGNLGDSGW